MQKNDRCNRMIANCVINYIMCKRKVSKIIYFYCLLSSNSLKTKVIKHKELNIHLYSYQLIKLFYRMNGVRVSTVVVGAKRAACVDCVRRSFLVTGAFLLTYL